MSESLRPESKEQAPKLENTEARAQLEKLGRQLEAGAEKEQRESDQKHEKESARKTIEKLAISGKEQAPSGSEKQRQKGTTPRAHKKQTYRATMNRIESQLPAYQRTFSRFINAEPVDKVSTVAAKTVARPSGLLGGGVIALIGLVIVTIFAANIGFEVKPITFVLFLVAGWALGLIVEAIYRLFKKLLVR